MSDLVSRLLAAIEAKEQKAQKAIAAKNVHCHVSSGPAGAEWTAYDGMVIGENEEPLWDCEGSDTLCMAPEVAEHVACNDPAAVLRRCAADRRLLARHKPLELSRETICEECSPGGFLVGWPCPTVQIFAEGLGISVEEETTGE